MNKKTRALWTEKYQPGMPEAKPSKYHNKKCYYQGEWFDSLRELTRWKCLVLRVKCGEIYDLKRQVSYEIIPACGPNRASHYIADFQYRKGEELIVEDCKGFRTKDYIIKKKLMLYKYGITVQEV